MTHNKPNMSRRLIEEIKPKGIMFFFFWVFTIILLLGALANFTVIQNNNGRMPIDLIEAQILDPDTYIFFEDKSQVDYYYLSDIIPFFSGRISFGDALMFVGLVGINYTLILNLFIDFKRRKKNK